MARFPTTLNYPSINKQHTLQQTQKKSTTNCPSKISHHVASASFLRHFLQANKTLDDLKIIDQDGSEMLYSKSNSFFFFDRTIFDAKTHQPLLRVTKDFIFPVYRFFIGGREVARVEPKVSIPTRSFVCKTKDQAKRSSVEIGGDFFNFNFNFAKNGELTGSVSKSSNDVIELRLAEGQDLVHYLAMCMVVGRQIELNDPEQEQNIFR
ncbi:hypothetical protein AKO1_007007 [Acrasis kona]|uniref:Phospholipid scramblase n=1 Tax=Acrasis kona TaxID=1008807 RepID=A0AAW2YVM7_9EUKA